MSTPPSQSSVAILRERYMRHLVSPLDGPRQGSVAGKGTRRGMRQGALWSGLTQTGWQDFSAVWQTSPEQVFVWSDHHLGHDNIIGYTDRPFGGSRHMDQSLLENACSVISPSDWLLFVGDIAVWKEPDRIQSWLTQCPGRKALVLGNHDLRGRERPVTAEAWQELGFEAVADVACLPALQGGPELWITHYPLPDDLIPEGVLNVHGHTHRYLMGGAHSNVCVEHLDYRPQMLLHRTIAPAIA